MSRNLCGNGAIPVPLFLVAACVAFASPTLARETDSAYYIIPVTLDMADTVFLVRPLARPDAIRLPAIQPIAAVAPAKDVNPNLGELGRIRQSWSIGVFR